MISAFLPYPAVNIQVIVQAVGLGNNPISSFVGNQPGTLVYLSRGFWLSCHLPPCKCLYRVRSMLYNSAHSPISASPCTAGGLDMRYQSKRWHGKQGIHYEHYTLPVLNGCSLSCIQPLQPLSDSGFRLSCDSSTTKRWQTRTFGSWNLFVGFDPGCLKRYSVNYSANPPNCIKVSSHR